MRQHVRFAHIPTHHFTTIKSNDNRLISVHCHSFHIAKPYVGDCNSNSSSTNNKNNSIHTHTHTVTSVRVQRETIRIVGVQFNIESRRHRIFRIASSEIRRSFFSFFFGVCACLFYSSFSHSLAFVFRTVIE